MSARAFRNIFLFTWLAWTVTAHAGQEVSYTNVATGLSSTNFTSLALTRFSADLGTLTGVEVRVNFSRAGGTFSVTNTLGSVTALFANIDATIQGGSGSLGFASLSVDNVPLAAADPAFPFSVPEGETVVSTVVPENLWFNQVQSIDPAFWGTYTGPGTVDFHVFNSSEVFVEAGGLSIPDPSNISLETSMTVTYYFVPEPSVAVLLVLSGVCAATVSARRVRGKGICGRLIARRQTASVEPPGGR